MNMFKRFFLISSVVTKIVLEELTAWDYDALLPEPIQIYAQTNGRQHSLKCAKGKRSRPVCPVVQQEEVESIPASSYECTMVHCVFAGPCDITTWTDSR
ncbi:hypothetical protein ANN_23072 [Periplaneta americana]|uniref:Secreted protein n=1 Tax=Periplaneta americana TaxID=6978 RepID=A0ABQ8SL73_PERAM|nr:hypothetical protein ANN_23072 [Periplaneta americana]